MEAKKQDPSELVRWERIEGVIYNMTPPPTAQHQSIVSRLQGEFYAFLKEKKCTSYVAPFGVWLNDEHDNYVEPDLTIICDPSKIHTKGCVGTPDLIVEVLSPATAVKDKGVKLKRYRISGVREYWIIDPLHQTVEVFLFTNNLCIEPRVYGKEDTLNVDLFPGLVIHLPDIFQ